MESTMWYGTAIKTVSPFLKYFPLLKHEHDAFIVVLANGGASFGDSYSYYVNTAPSLKS